MSEHMTVHPVADLFPMIVGDDRTELVADIRENGLRESIKLDHTGTVLVDGRNRLSCCEEAGVEPKFEKLSERTDLVSYIVSVNIKRRHLNAGQRAMLALDLLPYFEAETDPGGRPAKAPIAKLVADRPQVSPGPPAAPKKRGPLARDKAAAAVGSSGRLVGRAKRVRDADPELAEKVAAGDVALDKAEKQVKRHRQATEEAAARVATLDATVADAEGDDWKMLHGDFVERLAELEPGSVDLIVSDPPYSKEFLHLWAELSRVAASALKPQGVLVAMTGKIQLPDVMDGLSEHLRYGWIYMQPLPGSGTRILARHVVQQWKPWLAYSNGAWPSGLVDWHPDTLEGWSPSKATYRWEQSWGPAAELIERLTDPGALVLDPFCGTGSFGEATLATGRRFIGVELDGERFTGCVERLRAL